MKIIICSPANRFTGGPTLAHQLCRQLNELGYSSNMYYYHRKHKQPIVHERYKSLDLPYVNRIPKDKDMIVIVPETAPDILKKCKNSQKIVWWMSVDNYYEKYLPSRRNKVLNLGGVLKYDIFNGPDYHFVQSQ